MNTSLTFGLYHELEEKLVSGATPVPIRDRNKTIKQCNEGTPEQQRLIYALIIYHQHLENMHIPYRPATRGTRTVTPLDEPRRIHVEYAWEDLPLGLQHILNSVPPAE